MQTASVDVTVHVDNVEEAGSVVLSGLTAAPVVDTAIVAELKDDDGHIHFDFTGGGWQWQRKRPSDPTWSAVPAGAVGMSQDYPELNSYRPTDADRGYQLRAQVTYTDGHGDDQETRTSEATGVVSGLDHGPKITGDAVPQVTEHTTTVGDYTATDEDGDPVTWRPLAGDDASAFVLSGSTTDATRTLAFTTAPNYEQQSTYHLTLQAQSTPSGEGVSGANGTQTTTFPVQVTITDANDEGTLSLSTMQPQEGDTLTATLYDEDGIRSATFGWIAVYRGGQAGPAADSEPVKGANGSGTELVDACPFGPAGVVDSGLVGFQVQVRVSYTDAHGAYTPSTEWTASVVGKPAAPELTAKAGDGQVDRIIAGDQTLVSKITLIR